MSVLIFLRGASPGLDRARLLLRLSVGIGYEVKPGLAGALGRSGRGAPKSGAPGWGAGRCKISGALTFKTDMAFDGIEPAFSSILG